MSLFGSPDVEKLKAKGDVKGLIKALSYKKDWAVRQSAAEALGEMGDLQAVEPLLAALKGDESIQIPAIKALGQIGDTRAVRALVAARASEDEKTAKAGLEALRQLGPVGVDAVTTILQNTKEETAFRAMAAQALGQIGDPRAFEPLLATFQEDDPTGWLREAAADALGALGDSRAFDPLMAILNDRDGDEALREASAKALGQLGDLRAVESLIATFEETDPDGYEWPLQTSAAQALGELGDPRAVDAILKVLRDYAIEYWEFQYDMVKVLEQLGDQRAAGPLIELFDAEFFYAQEEAIEVLKTLTGQDLGEDPERWKQWWEAQKHG